MTLKCCRSNFFVGEAGEVIDHHFGVIFVE